MAMHWGMFTEHGVISTRSWQADSVPRIGSKTWGETTEGDSQPTPCVFVIVIVKSM